MARLILVLALALALPFAAGGARGDDTKFLSGTEDLPLMAGLQEAPGETVAFDTPGGRLFEAKAVGAVKVQAVEAFYDETLPQLGWTVVGPRQYLREGEYLHIEFSDEGEGELGVRFSLSPAPH